MNLHRNMSIYQQIVYHRLMKTFGAKTGAPTGPSISTGPQAKAKSSSLLQKDWGRKKGQTHA